MSDGKRLGDYEILKTLGSGGMGRVYQVRNTLTDRVEAMKVLLPDLQGHEDVAARFLREIKVLAALNHPNIASLHTALTIDNQLVMVMEYVEGESISSRLNNGPIEVHEALNYLGQVLGALSYAHKQHVIHRDIKPANMMLTTAGMVKLMDFGIARTDDETSKLTATGSTLGSLSYMSPEQVKGEKTDERSDLYSLGISLYEMVTGTKPFEGDSSFSIMAAHLTKAPRPPVELQPGLPAVVNDLILRSIAKTPEDRYQTADQFSSAVKRAAQAMKDDKTLVLGSQENVRAIPDAKTYVLGSQEASMAKTPVPPAARTAPAVTRAVTQTQPSAPAPAAVPAAQSVPIPPPAQASSHRGLYMGLGALVVVVMLIAAGLYLPGRKNASAAGPGPGAVQSAPVQQPVAEKPAEPPPVIEPKPTPAKKHVTGTPPVQVQQVPTGPSPEELDAIEHEIDQLTGRAGAVNSSLENLQHQQNAAGYGLRGDIASRWSMMKVNLAKAQDAISHNDAARAKRYADLASSDLDELERFLGR